MSVRHGLLALLSERPRYGYELRTEFEARTGGTWALNVGQVYTTLARLERDALVAATGTATGSAGDQQYYEVTLAGRAEASTWFTTPVRREDRPRDELAIKLALAVGSQEVDVRAVLQAQRTDTVRALQDYTRLKQGAQGIDLAWLLVLDSLVFQAEAEVRWLDHCEARLVQAAKEAGSARSDTAVPSAHPRAVR